MGRLTCLLLAIPLLVTTTTTTLRADAERLVLEEVAREGRRVPGTPAATVKRLLYPALGANGAVAMTCILEVATDGDGPRRVEALFAGEPGRLTRVACEGDVAPGLPDKPLLKELELVGIDAAGRVLFNGKTIGAAPGVESDVVWYGMGESVGRFARSGEQMPGTAVVATEVLGESVAADGTIVLRARLRGGGDEDAYYVGRPDGLRRLPDPTVPPPGGDLVPFGRPTAAPRVNAVGQVLVCTSSPNGDGDESEALWLGTPAGFRRIADNFTSVPALEGKPFSDLQEHATHAGPPYALGDGGHVVFRANWSVITEEGVESRSGLWTSHDGKFQLIARDEIRLPGCDPNEFALIKADTASVDVSGKAIVFLGMIWKGGGEGLASGTWLYYSGKLSLLMRSDRPIAGVEGLPYGVHRTPRMLSRDGRFVQRVEIAGKAGMPGHVAVAAFQRGKGWSMLAAPGQRVEVGGRRAVLTRVDWVSDLNPDGRFLLIGELLGRPGTALYRASTPALKAE